MEKKRTSSVIALERSLSEILREKSIKDITIQELCDYAGVNRSTFYLHFKDIYALNDYVTNQLKKNFDRLINVELTLNENLPFITQYIIENMGALKVYLNPKHEDYIGSFLGDQLNSLLDNSLKDNMIDLITASNYITFGILGVLQNWLMSDCEQSVEKITESLQNLVENSLSNSRK